MADCPVPQQNSPYARLQDLPSKAARFCLETERFCRHELNRDLTNKTLVVAYSGGADSTALLFSLHYLSRRLGMTLHAAILDHGLREEAVRELTDAASVCARLGVPFHSRRSEVAEYARECGMGLEEAGRIARMAFLEDVREWTGSDWIATGHQLNDLAEDSLMRMIRGAGWPALGGMAGFVEESRTVRPLLLTPRAEIEGFLQALGERWHDDRMNDDDAYLRNRVRKHLLPLFLRENPAFLDNTAERWRAAREDAVFLERQTAAIQHVSLEGGIFVPRHRLSDVPAALRLRKYMEILALLGKGQATAAHLRALDAAWRRGEGGKHVQFPGGKSAVIRKGGIFFSGANAL